MVDSKRNLYLTDMAYPYMQPYEQDVTALLASTAAVGGVWVTREIFDFTWIQGGGVVSDVYYDTYVRIYRLEFTTIEVEGVEIEVVIFPLPTFVYIAQYLSDPAANKAVPIVRAFPDSPIHWQWATDTVIEPIFAYP